MSSLRLNNPPLICVAARVQFALVAKIEDYIANLQEALRLNGFPIALGVAETEVWHVDPEQGPDATLNYEKIKRWDFSNPEKTVVLRIDRVSATILFTNYDYFDNAKPEYEKLFPLVEKTIPKLLVESVQLRYINHIPVLDESDPSDWVLPSVLGIPNLPKMQRIGSASETSFKTERDALFVVRCLSLGPNNLILPAELFPLGAKLKHPKWSETPFILLENLHEQRLDRFDFEADRCVHEIEKLRKAIQEVFLQTVTPKARELWQ